MSDPRDHYEILHIAPTADEAMIRAAYRALAQRHHPDVAGPAGEDMMRRLNAAWEVLGDPTRRAEYDQYLRRPNGQSRPTAVEQPTENRPAARGPSWTGTAGPPPGRPSGSVLGFGRFFGWSIGEIMRVDPGYLEWLETRPEGWPYVGEIDERLRRAGRRGAREARVTAQRPRRWPFGRG